jgi:hypothetical protein
MEVAEAPTPKVKAKPKGTGGGTKSPRAKARALAKTAQIIRSKPGGVRTGPKKPMNSWSTGPKKPAATKRPTGPRKP